MPNSSRPRPRLRFRLLAISALIASSCTAAVTRLPEAMPSGAALLQDVNPDGALVVHPVYSSAFQAMESALQTNDLDVAKATLGQLRGRLARDRATVPTLADAKTRTDEIAHRTASGELPCRENVDAAMKMADGFERVIEGRLRLRELKLHIEVRRSPGAERVEVTLVGESTWDRPLVLRPGIGRVDVLRTSLEPRSGIEANSATQTGLEDLVELEIPSGGESRVVMGTLAIEVPVGAIATRMRVDVTFNAGTIEEAGTIYPARVINARSARRTDLAGWVPAMLVEPSELVRLIERGGAPLPAVLERAVRIAPDRRAETLDLLGRAVRTLPVQAVDPLVPALRWLVSTNEFGRGTFEWRTWLIQRYEEREQEGSLAIQ